MRYTVAVFALALTSSFAGQEAKKPGGPVPPTLDRPGEQHPMPIPRQNPVVPPDVRTPRHETGKERPVGADNGAKKEQKGNSGQARSPKTGSTPQDGKR